MIMVHSKRSIIVHQHSCKHCLRVLWHFWLNFLIHYLKMSQFWIYRQNLLFWFASLAVVVMGKEHNISEANRQLCDTTYYKRLDQVPTSDHERLVNEKVTEMLTSKEISEDNIEYLTVANPRAGRFYLLPKIPKSGNSGSPIVTANGHPTERMSECVDLHPKPIVSR